MRRVGSTFLYDRRWTIFWIAPALLIVGCYYTWNTMSSRPTLFDEDGGPYGQLAQSFLHGQTALMVTPDPKLLAAPDPYDGSADRGNFPWDYSYYKGKFYLYFGPTPAIFLFIPYYLITGQTMDMAFAFLIISCVNVLLFTLLLRLMVKAWFPHVPLPWQAALIVVYGFSNLAPYHLRRGMMYEMEEMSAATFLLAFFITLFMVLTRPRYRLFWLAMASLAYGCAFATRVTYVFAGVVLIFLGLHFFYLAREGKTSLKQFIIQMICLTLPSFVVAMGIAWYNDVRFDSPTQFGAFYCLTTFTPTNPPFSLRFIPDRMWEDLIMPPVYYPQFPYIFPVVRKIPGLFADRLCWENVCSAFSAFPICWFAFLWLREVERLPVQGHMREMKLFGMSAVGAWVTVLIPLLLFFHINIRHVIDIIMPLLVLATFSILARRERGPFGWIYGTILVIFMMICIYDGFAFGLVGPYNWIGITVPS